MTTRVWVSSNKVVSYGKYGEVWYGQVLELQGYRNDALMLAPHVAQFRLVEKEQEDDVERCVCGRDFINNRAKSEHMRDRRHESINLDAPIKERRANGQYRPVNPDGDDHLGLEIEGAPSAPRPGQAPVSNDPDAALHRVGAGFQETIRVGGGPPKGI